jgi:hypothetical protein
MLQLADRLGSFTFLCAPADIAHFGGAARDVGVLAVVNYRLQANALIEPLTAVWLPSHMGDKRASGPFVR